jgi:hypothetical protein
MDDLTTRVGKLRGKVNRYRDRYGDLEEFKPLERLDHAIAARRARLEQLRRMAAEIEADIKAVETELAGIERGVEALLGEVLPRIKRQYAEAWSPTPVLGYRLWAWSNGELHGVRTHWKQPELTATCQTTLVRSEIPHSDGSCGRLGCGIYAAKSVRRLLTEFAPALRSAFAVGLVALSGKVVEHEHGYRGAGATVVALAAVDSMRAEFTADAKRLHRIFDGEGLPTDTQRLPDRRSLFEAIVEYLTEQERNQNPWT